jgi:predicted AlkP superfamily pyrophosphatase or phosphodiesterase
MAEKIDTKKFLSDLECFGNCITPEQACELAELYIEAMMTLSISDLYYSSGKPIGENVNKNEVLEGFYKKLKEYMGLDDEIVSFLLKDSDYGNRGVETSIMDKLGYATKNPEARRLIYLATTSVYNILRSLDLT